MMRTLRPAALVAIALFGLCAAERTVAATGDMWEVTSQMTMEGMPAGMAMPAQTSRVCTAKEWTKPPVANDDRSHCEMIDFKTTATKSTWKMKCEGMTGEAEITRTSPDAYTGWMKIMAPQGAMTMSLTGKKVGECDAVEAKKEREAQVARIESQAAASQKLAADAKRQACMAPVEGLDLRMLNAQAVACEGTSIKAAFCDKFKSNEGFRLVCRREPDDATNGPNAVAAYCSADFDALKKTNCQQALKTEDLDLLGRCCKDEARGIAAAHCAGRSYTSMTGDKYQAFCATFAKDVMGGH